MGIGVTYTPALDPLLDEVGLLDLIEIEPQTFWLDRRGAGGGIRFDPALRARLHALPCGKLIHGVGHPVGGSGAVDHEQLAALAALASEWGAPWLSEHLSFNSFADPVAADRRVFTGFFLPPRQTAAGVAQAAATIRAMGAALPVPVAVENGVSYLRPRGDEMEDGAFVAAVADAADCGLVLDVHNAFANALNRRQPLRDFIASLPLERVWEVHIAGGMEHEGFYLDAHSGAIPDPLLEVTADLLTRLPNCRALVFEIYPSFIDVVGHDLVREQLRRLRRIWEARTRPVRPPEARQPLDPPPVAGGPSPTAWEAALGALVVGPPAPEAGGRDLAGDPGVALVGRLVREFRGSMLVNTLRLSLRYLTLAFGPKASLRILTRYWDAQPPAADAAGEAERFVAWAREALRDAPLLPGLLALEIAVVRTLIDDETRVVGLSWDPLPVLQSLAEGRLPAEPPTSGSFEIAITGNETGASDPAAVRRPMVFGH